MLLNFPLTSILVFSSMRPVYTGMANVGMVFLSAVSPWCWSICRSWSRGIWEPLFHTNELHAFQPTISMFFCFRRGDRWTAVHSDKKWENGLLVMYTNAVCVHLYVRQGSTISVFVVAFLLACPVPTTKNYIIFFCMGDQENTYKIIWFHWPHDGEVLYCLN